MTAAARSLAKWLPTFIVVSLAACVVTPLAWTPVVVVAIVVVTTTAE